MGNRENHQGRKKLPLEVVVECYAGYRGEETPRRFLMGQRTVEVKAVLDRWLSPNHRYFKVIGDDKGLYIIRHDIIFHIWQLTFFKQVN